MKQLKFFALVLASLIGTPAALAQGKFEEGKHYEVMAPQTKTEPVVEEFFNYACAACYGAEKFAAQLKQNNPGIKFKYSPVELRESWKIYVKAYYIGEKLNVLDQSHTKLFHRLHVEKKFFRNEADMKEFFVSLGVDEKEYDKVAKSYWLKTQMRQAKQYAFKNRVTSTPVYLVNKRYKLNSKSMSTYNEIEQAVVELSGYKPKETASN